MEKILKYPRTPHLEGSRLQDGDGDLKKISFASLIGKNVVIEEKVDGANVGISFDTDGHMLLQSRGHFLTGGYREKHYDLFKVWANERRELLLSLLSDRYILYGEWLYPKHKVYYDALPDYFLEFDIFDKEKEVFLDTDTRRTLLQGSGIYSVPVLARGIFQNKADVLRHLETSLFVTPFHLEALKEECLRLSLDFDLIMRETDASPLAEGLYIKVEENGKVSARMKYVREGYLQLSSIEGRFLARPIIPNRKIRKENT